MGSAPVFEAPAAAGSPAAEPARATVARAWARLGPRTLLAALFVAALLLRLGAVALDGDYVPKHDAFDYDRHARSIAAGEGFPESGYVPDGGPSALRAPAYPYLLGGVYALSDSSTEAGRVLGALLGALAAVLTCAVARAVWGRRVGLVAGALVAVFPPLVLLSRELFSESLFIVLVLAAVLAVLRFRSAGALRWAALAGALCGLAALTRNPGLVLLVPVAIGVWTLRPRLGVRALAAPALVVLCALVVIAPWTLRNAVELGRFVPVASSSGFALAGTYNPDSRDDPEFATSWRTPTIVAEYAPLFRTAGVDEGTLDATLRREALELAGGDLGYVGEVAAHNIARLVLVEGGAVVGLGEEVTERGIGSGAEALERWALAIAAALAALGVFAIMRSRRQAGPDRAGGGGGGRAIPGGPLFLWLVPLALILVAAPIAGLPRYRTPADPFLLILAAIGLAAAAGWIRARRPALRRRLIAGVAAAAALLAVAGCGGGEGEGGTPGPTGAASPAGPTKAAYIARADAICGDALRESKRLARDALGDGDAAAGAGGDALAFTTERLVEPGLAIRERQAERLRRLEPPAEDRAALDDYLGLFEPIEALTRARIRAGRDGALEEVRRLEGLMVRLAEEQRTAAAEFGFEDCAADFAGAAFANTDG